MNKENRKTAGVSLQEIENFAKNHRFEVFFCLSFILSLCFSFIFFGAGWSIFCTTLGGIVGLWLYSTIQKSMHKLFTFLYKQETMTQVIIGIVGWIISIFLPPLIFLCLGLMGGAASRFHTAKTHNTH